MSHQARTYNQEHIPRKYTPGKRRLSSDTLLVFGLEASTAEIEAINEWLKREGTCLLIAPHHDVGFTDDPAQRQMEYKHHGDALVPRQQRFSSYTRFALGVASNITVPKWRFKYFEEFANRSTFQGHSIQFSGSLHF